MVDNILDNLDDKLKTSSKIFNKIVDFNKKNQLTNNQLKLILNISTNIHNLSDEIEELYYNCLDYNEINKTAEEKIRIREFKINNEIKEALLPMMFVMKLVLENQQ